MSHSKEEEEKEDIDCLIEHTQILLNTLTNIKKNPSKKEIIKLLSEVKKRVDFMLSDLKGEL